MAQAVQDGSDMAKLQKKVSPLKKYANGVRASLTKPPTAATLQPADTAPQTQHLQKQANSASPYPINLESKLQSGSPPRTPGIYHYTSSHAVKQSRPDLLTPPISPEGINRTPLKAGSVPQSQFHVPTGTSSNGPSRVSSNASSSHGIATYRGPEVTRPGEQTMLQMPSQQILTNPLSQFSRPRQSTLTSSPDKKRPESRGVNEEAHEHRAASLHSARPQSTASNNPVTIIPGNSFQQPTPVNNPYPSGVHRDDDPRPMTQEHGSDNGQQGAWEAPSDQRKSLWRRSFHHQGSAERSSSAKPKKDRRRSFSFMRSNSEMSVISYANTRAGPPPSLKHSLKGELPSNKTSVYKEQAKAESLQGNFNQHPAVRPHSVKDMPTVHNGLISPHHPHEHTYQREQHTPQRDTKGKGKMEETSYPVYERCSCCGKLRKPRGNESALGPVLENEHLRANFTFELERTSTADRRKSFGSTGAGNRAKHVPILPMEVGNQMRQAMLEPPQAQTRTGPPTTRRVNPQQVARPHSIATAGLSRTGDLIAQSSQPLAMMSNSVPDSKVARFSSLHAKKILPEKIDTVNNDTVPPVPDVPRRFGSLYASRRVSAPISSDSPLIDETIPIPSLEVTNPEAILGAQQQLPEQSPPENSQNDTDTVVDREEENANDLDDQFANDFGPGMDLSSIDGSFFGGSVSPAIASEPRELNALSTPQPDENEGAPPARPTEQAQAASNVSSNRIEEPTNIVTEQEDNEVNTVVSPSSTTTPSSQFRSLVARKPVAKATEAETQSPVTPPLPQSEGENRSLVRATVVRIIPTPAVPERSSARPSSFVDHTGKAIMIGDWILPNPRVNAPTSPLSDSSMQPSALPSPLQIGRTSIDERGYEHVSSLPKQKPMYLNGGLHSSHDALNEERRLSRSSINSNYTELTNPQLEEATSGRMVNVNGGDNASMVMVNKLPNSGVDTTKRTSFHGSMGSDIARRMREADTNAKENLIREDGSSSKEGRDATSNGVVRVAG